MPQVRPQAKSQGGLLRNTLQREFTATVIFKCSSQRGALSNPDVLAIAVEFLAKRQSFYVNSELERT
eukprot:2629223-Heterocapsa_arctica.AAC.1